MVIWDGKGQWDARLQPSPWRMERDGRGWMVNLDKLTWEEPAGLGIRDAEQKYLDAERRRIAYVAATRARDLLIIPKAGSVAPESTCVAIFWPMPLQHYFRQRKHMSMAQSRRGHGSSRRSSAKRWTMARSWKRK